MAAWLLLVVALCGCTSPAGTADAASPDDLGSPQDLAAATDSAPARSCGPIALGGSAACNDCLAKSCCTVIASCSDDGGCTGAWDHAALTGCMTNGCATACGRPLAHCGGIQATPLSCATCVFNHCCAEATRCGANDNCLALIYQCIDKLGASLNDCETMLPDGVTDFEALNGCGVIQCPGCF
jgi:hypothetical protein